MWLEDGFYTNKQLSLAWLCPLPHVYVGAKYEKNWSTASWHIAWTWFYEAKIFIIAPWSWKWPQGQQNRLVAQKPPPATQVHIGGKYEQKRSTGSRDLWLHQWEGRTYGQTDGAEYYIPCSSAAGDQKAILNEHSSVVGMQGQLQAFGHCVIMSRNKVWSLSVDSASLQLYEEKRASKTQEHICSGSPFRWRGNISAFPSLIKCTTQCHSFKVWSVSTVTEF